jgi:hypothetical protein
MRFFIVFLLCIGFLSCRHKEVKNLAIEKKPSAKIDSLSSELTIVDEKFLDNPFQFGKVTVENLRDQFENLKIEKAPVKNVHIKNQIDSILAVKVNHSEFVLYKLPKIQYLESAVVRDENIRFSRDINVGMSKDDFKIKFESLRKREEIPSKIIIGRKDSQEYLIFTFTDGRLAKVEYTGYVD